jgi:hypothetical protein
MVKMSRSSSSWPVMNNNNNQFLLFWLNSDRLHPILGFSMGGVLKSGDDELSNWGLKKEDNVADRYKINDWEFQLGFFVVGVTVFYSQERWATTAVATIFVIAAMTDWLDGYLARKVVWLPFSSCWWNKRSVLLNLDCASGLFRSLVVSWGDTLWQFLLLEPWSRWDLSSDEFGRKTWALESWLCIRFLRSLAVF